MALTIFPARTDGAAPDSAPDPVGKRLLAAAAEVFAERGYDRAGVAEIARRAGLTTGAIYSRFTGKADLLVSALHDQAEDELDALFADHRFEGRVEDILTIAGSHLVSRSTSPDHALLLEAFVAARRDPAVSELLRLRMQERRDRLTVIIETAKEGGGISTDLDTEALVAFCHAVGLGFLLFDALDLAVPPAREWEQLIALLVAAVRRGDANPIDPPVATSKEG